MSHTTQYVLVPVALLAEAQDVIECNCASEHGCQGLCAKSRLLAAMQSPAMPSDLCSAFVEVGEYWPGLGQYQVEGTTSLHRSSDGRAVYALICPDICSLDELPSVDTQSLQETACGLKHTIPDPWGDSTNR